MRKQRGKLQLRDIRRKRYRHMQRVYWREWIKWKGNGTRIVEIQRVVTETHDGCQEGVRLEDVIPVAEWVTMHGIVGRHRHLEVEGRIPVTEEIGGEPESVGDSSD
jgi:hypothetical protein